MKLIRFLNNGGDQLDAEELHYDDPHTDHTLCGLTLDGDNMTAGSFEVVYGAKVTCPQCVNIIRHCRRAKI